MTELNDSSVQEIHDLKAANAQLKTDLEAAEKALEQRDNMLDAINAVFDSSKELFGMIDNMKNLKPFDKLGRTVVVLCEAMTTAKFVIEGKIGRTIQDALKTYSSRLKPIGIDANFQEIKNKDEFEQMKALAEAQNQSNTHH